MATLLLVTGPSGAGKSTTCREFLKSAEGTWAYLNQDEIRQLVKVGYEITDDDRKTWSEPTKKQWYVSIPNCVAIAKNYLKQEINCLVDFFADPEEFKLWRKELSGVQYKLFVLIPDEEVVVLRNSAREDNARLKETVIRGNYRLFSGWLDSEAVIVRNNSNEINKTIEILHSI